MNIKYLIGIIFLLSIFFVSDCFADSDIVINEFQVEPSGSSQWIELYNKGDENIDLTGWILDDDGGTENFPLPLMMLNAKQCIAFQSSKFNLNTSNSDTVKLFHTTDLVDSYSYNKSPGNGVSYGRTPDGSTSWDVFTSPTREKLNIDGTICAPPTPTPTVFPTPTPTKMPTPTRTPSPTKTPTPSPTAVSTPTKIPTVTPFKESATYSYDGEVSDVEPTAVLGISDMTLSPTSKPVKPSLVLTKGVSKENHNYIAAILCSVGAILLIACGILFYLDRKKAATL